MKVVRLYNETSNTLMAYNIPFDGISKKVSSGEDIIIGNYDSTYNKFYMAMVKAGFRMSIEDKIITKEKKNNTTEIISSKGKEMTSKKTPSKNSTKSKSKDGVNND